MAEKRRDSKGRVLRTGEVQRSDGKYMYRYTDAEGQRHTVYSWKLVETDRLPAGKKDSPALRTLIQQIDKDLEDGIHPFAADELTLNAVFRTFMEERSDLKETTRCNYLCLYRTHVEGSLGRRPVSAIRYSDVRKFYLSLSQEKGLKISTIRTVNSILWQVMEGLVRDSVLRKNPVTGVFIDLSKRLKEVPEHRNALTIAQQKNFLDYIAHSRQFSRYHCLFVVLLGTGLRVGEALGLRWCDVDFKSGFIRVDHSLSYKDTEEGVYEYHVSSPKTRAGIRTVPMFEDVKKALQKEKRKKKNPNWAPFTVDGYTGFIFLNANGKVYTPSSVFDKIQVIVADYNREETARAWAEHRAPVLIPKISAHILRHTFCTRLCETDANIKVIQDVMGHKNIRTTMDVYNEATAEEKLKNFRALEGAIYLG